MNQSVNEKLRKVRTGPLRKKDRRIAYFSMELGVHSDIPTYSGGLGILAGRDR